MAPFNCSAARQLKSNIRPGPGPGAYIDVNNPHYSSVSHKLVGYLNEKIRAYKKGVSFQCFGTNVERFKGNREEVPGPGSYISHQKAIGSNLRPKVFKGKLEKPK